MASGNQSNEQQEKQLQLDPMNQPTIARVAVKIPPFWIKNIPLWFLQIESQFVTSGVTNEDTKFHMLIAHLESDVLDRISDLVMKPPTKNKYQALKERLIEEFSVSEAKRIKVLLNDLQLGDNKPTHLLREMKKLSQGAIDDTVLKTMFLEHMPVHARAVLLVSDDKLEKLAIMADKILDNTPSNVVAVAESSNTVAQAIERLQLQVSELATQVRARSRSRSRSGPGRNTRRRARSSSRKFEKCWYHFKFGERANKCTPPCTASASSEN